jgi:hypothetical protein
VSCSDVRDLVALAVRRLTLSPARLLKLAALLCKSTVLNGEVLAVPFIVFRSSSYAFQ